MRGNQRKRRVASRASATAGASRTVASSGAETFQYDAIGRLDNHASDLGAFTLSYLGQTSQITQRQLLPVTSNLATTWSYLPNSGDRRLAGIGNVGLSRRASTRTYSFTTTPRTSSPRSPRRATPRPSIRPRCTQTASYNNLNQLTNLSGQALTYDADGNLLSDGQRNYTWDAENRLIGITYPGQSGKATAFSYDGLGRRTAIASTPAGGGSTVTTSYIWCGARPCQARNCEQRDDAGILRRGRVRSRLAGAALLLRPRPDRLGAPRVRQHQQRAGLRLRPLRQCAAIEPRRSPTSAMPACSTTPTAGSI